MRKSKTNYKDLPKGPTVAKNPIVKMYNFIMRQHMAIGAKMRIRKDASQKRAFMEQSWYKKRLEVIVAMFKKCDELIAKDPELWKEAQELCETPRDYSAKPLKGREIDLAKEYENLKGFYIKPEPVKKKKSTKKSTKKEETNV
jgi:hypothetical protein